MSEFDDVIREAREGLAPRATDQARVWKQLAARAGIAATAGAAIALVAKTSAGATGAATAGILSGQSLGALTKVMLGSMVLTLAGAGIVVSVTSHDSAPRMHAPAASSVRGARARGASRAPLASAPEVPVPPASARAVVSDPVRRSVASASAAPARADLSQELALLVEARQASEKADHDRARSLLGRLDAEHPGGALLEERSALRAVAACAAGDASGPQRASDFLRRYSGSMYAARVQRACRGDATTAGTPITTKRFTDLEEGAN
jgi:hypothetical protein